MEFATDAELINYVNAEISQISCTRRLSVISRPLAELTRSEALARRFGPQEWKFFPTDRVSPDDIEFVRANYSEWSAVIREYYDLRFSITRDLLQLTFGRHDASSSIEIDNLVQPTLVIQTSDLDFQPLRNSLGWVFSQEARFPPNRLCRD